MDAGERFSSTRDNPRTLAYPSADRPLRAAPPASADLPSRSAASVVERFRTLLREREEELRAVSGEASAELGEDEVVRVYEEVLGELTVNSKPVITELTIIAGQQIQFAEGIADVICTRILEVSVEQKLPTLYLLDSIVKNIGRGYVRFFATRLPKVFCQTYNEIHPSQHSSMRHLFRTWSQVFPHSALQEIEDKLEFSPSQNHRSSGAPTTRASKSPSPHPFHGIHVNPKYLEARHQLEQSTVHEKGMPSSVQVYRQDISRQYADYDGHQTEVIPHQLGVGRAFSPQSATARTSSVVGDGDLMPRPANNILRPKSPPRVGIRRFTDQNGWVERNWPSNENPRVEGSGVHNINGNAKQKARDLIVAYGNPDIKSTPYEKASKVPRIDVGDFANNSTSGNWKVTGEEEYSWEAMSPTLVDQSRKSNSQQFEPITGNWGVRAGLTRSGPSVLDSNFERHHRISQPQLPIADDPGLTTDNKIPAFGVQVQSSRGSVFTKMAIQNESLPHFHSHTRDTGKMPYLVPNNQQNLGPGFNPRPGQLPIPVGELPSSVSHRYSIPLERLPNTDLPLRRLPGAIVDSSNTDTSRTEKPLMQRQYSPPAPSIQPSFQNSQFHSFHPNLKTFGTAAEILEKNKPIENQNSQPSLVLHSQYDVPEVQTSGTNKLLQLHHQQSGFSHLNERSQELHIQSQNVAENVIPHASAYPSHLVPQPPSYFQKQPPLGSVSTHLSSSLPASVQGPQDTSLNAQVSHLPPLPPGPPPIQMDRVPQNSIAPAPMHSATGAFSGLIGSLMAHGLISLTSPPQHQTSLGSEFNVELKGRHESAIDALYNDLPRQCTTCGLRFKCQEEHRTHMDWHVTKNRISKNRKQKPSRKWFVSEKEWLSGTEALGNDVVPGFLPSELVLEKKEVKEVAVPADEDQNACALCGEPFEEFYSDEIEEWMYRGAVYLNAPDGYIGDLDRSHLGPIVHAKCRSGSTVS